MSEEPIEPTEPIAPVVTGHPNTRTVEEGSTTTFTSNATGEPTPSVQWELSVSNGPWNNVSGATSNSLVLSNVTTNLTGNRYRATFINEGGSASSNAATLNVNPKKVAPTITGDLEDVTVVADSGSVIYAVEVSGYPTPEIQWEAAIGDGSWSLIEGSTGTQFSMESVGLEDNGLMIRAVATNSEGRAVSGTGTITVVPGEDYVHHRFGWTHEVEVVKSGLILWGEFFREGGTQRVPPYMYDMTDEEQISIYGDVHFRGRN